MFKNDAKMPIFSLLESEAAIRYLDLLLEIAETKKAQMPAVLLNGTEIAMEQAVLLRETYRKEFMYVVETEAKRISPDIGAAEIKLRAHNILNSMIDTSRLSSHYPG